MTNEGQWFAIGLALAVFLAVGWAVTHSIRNRSKENEHTQDDGISSQPIVAQVRSGEQKDSAQNQPHDRHDWKEAFYPGTWANWALALFAAWAGYMALLTLRAIKRQSDIMVNKERARLRIEIFPLNYDWPETLSLGPSAELKVSYCGTTEAFIMDSYLYCNIRESRDAVASGTDVGIFDLPQVINGTVGIPEQKALIWPSLQGDVLDSVKEGKSFVHLYGFIKYKDIFKNDRETGFYYIWVIEKHPYFPQISNSRWVKKKCKGYDKET